MRTDEELITYIGLMLKSVCDAQREIFGGSVSSSRIINISPMSYETRAREILRVIKKELEQRHNENHK